MKNVVIVGAGHAAGQVVASLRQKQFAGRITLIGEERWYPYQRPPLSKKYLAGELPAERLYVKPQSFYDQPGIEVILDSRVTAIDRRKKAVLCGRTGSFDYDYLVLATGSRPRILEVPGTALDGVHYLRTIDDVDAIRRKLAPGGALAIIGAGYIGLEVAAVANQLGLQVTVIEMADRVMSRVVSGEMSAFYQDVHAAMGVSIKLSAGIRGISGNGQVEAVVLDSGERIAADAVVIGIGIVPNTELAGDAGLEISNGIVVDDHCRTGDPAIFAVGDCTCHPNEVLGFSLRLESVQNALDQARTAAMNICGEDTRYSEVPWFWSDQYDLKLQIAGLSQGYDRVIIRGVPESRSFSCLYLRQGRLISVDAINRPKDFIQSKALIAAHARIDPALLADPDVQLKDLL